MTTIKACTMPFAIRVWALSFVLYHTAFAQAQSLEDKLEAQWKRYSEAQQNVVSRVNDASLPEEKRIVSRSEFESWITAPSRELTLTLEDIAELQARQRTAIGRSLAQARNQSTISFDAMRTLDYSRRNATIERFCAAFPKGGMLHIHPSGSFPKQALADAFQSVNPDIMAKEIADGISAANSRTMLYPHEMVWLRSLPESTPFLALSQENRERLLSMTRLPSGTHGFERFDSVFWFVWLPVNTWQTYGKLLRAFAQRASEQHVRYVEFTTGVDAEDITYATSYIEGIEKDFGVTIRFNASFARTAPSDALRKAAAELLPIKHRLLVGIDLLANETNTPALENGQIPYATVLGSVQKGESTLHRTMHAGELGDTRNPRDAMILGAERLGHGVKLAQDPVATEYARKKGIAIEVNLTSNEKLRAIETLDKHPFLSQLRLGIPVSLSTDDEGIFETDINSECRKAISKTNIQYAEMKEMTLNSIRTSFLPDSEKAAMLDLVSNDLTRFETSWEQ